MTTINYIAVVDTETGVISTVNFCPGGGWPDEGPIEGADPPQEIFWIDEKNWPGMDSGEIFEEWYRRDGAWHHRGPRPGDYYDWNTETFEWQLNSENLWTAIRGIRRQKLLESDWTQLADALSVEKKLQWRGYRAELRDIPELYPNVTSIEGITWPEPPE